MIEGGYYLKARRIQESSIMHAPPHVREIWDWLLMKAMFANGTELERGQVLTSYDEIRDGLSWSVGYRVERYSKWDCEKAMKWLTKEQMITVKKVTRGMVITVTKYEYYQNPSNYARFSQDQKVLLRKSAERADESNDGDHTESHTVSLESVDVSTLLAMLHEYESHTESHKKATRKPQGTDTIDKNGKKGKKNTIAASAACLEPPYSDIVDLYHRHLPNLSRVVSLSDKRKSYIRARWNGDKERQALDWWEDFFSYCAKCKPISVGIPRKDGSMWTADLEWIVTEGNFLKILEGKYE